MFRKAFTRGGGAASVRISAADNGDGTFLCTADPAGSARQWSINGSEVDGATGNPQTLTAGEGDKIGVEVTLEQTASRLIPAPLPLPSLVTAPSFSVATAEAGDPIGINEPVFSDATSVAFTLTLNSADVKPDLDGLTITTAAGELVATWTPSNATGAGDPVSISLTVDEATVVEPAPTAANALPGLTFTQNSGPRTVDAASDYSNAIGGTWSVSGAGATITQAGLVTIPDTTPLDAVAVVVTYAKAGFPDTISAFPVTIEAEIVVPDPEAPTIASAASFGAGPVVEGSDVPITEPTFGGDVDEIEFVLELDDLDVTGDVVDLTYPDAAAGTLVGYWTASGPAGSVTATASIVIEAAVVEPDPEAPTLAAPIPDQTVVQGESITPINVTDHFSHPRPITYTLTQSPGGVSLSGDIISGTIDPNFTPGEALIEVVARADDINTIATATLTITARLEALDWSFADEGDGTGTVTAPEAFPAGQLAATDHGDGTATITFTEAG